MRSGVAESQTKKAERYLIAALMLIGMLVRLVALGQFPGGVNQDEAYSAYEAYCLLSDGMDSWGYRYPVYLTVWGSGQSALQSYLMVPMVALFGLELWAIRIPQAVNACISLPVIYALLKRLFDRRTALIGLAFLAICPWHMMMARWGLDCNFAPGLLLLGLCFFAKGVDHPKYYVLSGFAYGLSLYAYATIWVVLPFVLLFHGIYLGYVGKLKLSKALVLGVFILGVMALPLLMFLAVNWGIIEEIRLPFLSVPRMPMMRGNEVSFSNLYENTYRMVKTFLLQRDDMVWNASDEFGLYYHLSLPFMVIGGIVMLIRTAKSIANRQYDGSALILVWLAFGVIQGCLIDGNVNRLNFLHFPLILCAIMGLAWTEKKLRGRWKKLSVCIASAYGISFMLFAGFYFTGFQKQIDSWYDTGLEPALKYAQSMTDEEIRVSDKISYPKILFYGQIEPEVFRETVVWRGEPSAFMSMESVEGFRFGVDDTAMAGNVCILKADELGESLPEGMSVKVFDQIAVLHPADPSEI